MSAPVGDETEALREARDFLWMLKDGPQKGNLAPALGYIEKLVARVAGLEAREASLRDALEEACDWLDDDLSEDPGEDDELAKADRSIVQEWRRVLDETFVPRAPGTGASEGAS